MSAERIINPSTHSLPVYNVLDGSPLLALHMQAFDLEEFGHLLTIDTHGAEQTLHLGLDIFLRLLLELLPLTILPVVPRRLHTLAPALSNHPVVHSSGVTLTPGMRCAWLSTPSENQRAGEEAERTEQLEIAKSVPRNRVCYWRRSRRWGSRGGLQTTVVRVQWCCLLT